MIAAKRGEEYTESVTVTVMMENAGIVGCNVGEVSEVVDVGGV